MSVLVLFCLTCGAPTQKGMAQCCIPFQIHPTLLSVFQRTVMTVRFFLKASYTPVSSISLFPFSLSLASYIYCDYCRENSLHQIWSTFVDQPRVLIIHMRRFDNEGNKNSKIRHRIVSYRQLRNLCGKVSNLVENIKK